MSRVKREQPDERQSLEIKYFLPLVQPPKLTMERKMHVLPSCMKMEDICYTISKAVVVSVTPNIPRSIFVKHRYKKLACTLTVSNTQYTEGVLRFKSRSNQEDEWHLFAKMAGQDCQDNNSEHLE